MIILIQFLGDVFKHLPQWWLGCFQFFFHHRAQSVSFFYSIHNKEIEQQSPGGVAHKDGVALSQLIKQRRGIVEVTQQAVAKHVGNLHALHALAPCNGGFHLEILDRVEHCCCHAALAVLLVVPQRLSQLSALLFRSGW